MALRLVPYCHAAHHAQIRHICKDVYGGTDYLPAEILDYSQDDRKVVRVLETAERRDVLGVVCVERQLDAAFLMGLRVHPQHFGQGIGARLTAAAEAAARELPGVKTLQTATIQSNPSMRAILAKRGWQLQQVLDSWPQNEQTVHEAQQAGATSVLSFVEGAAAAVSTPTATALVDRWKVCTSLPDLRQCISRLQQGVQPSVTPASQAARLFFPFKYAPLAVDSTEVAAALKAGHVLLLNSSNSGDSGAAGVAHERAANGTCNGNTAEQSAGTGDGAAHEQRQAAEVCCHQGALIITPAVPVSRIPHTVVGVIGNSAAVIESGLLAAARIQPHFVAWVARPQDCVPELFRQTPTHAWYCLIFSKDL